MEAYVETCVEPCGAPGGGPVPPGPGPGGSGQPFVTLRAGPGPGPKKLIFMMRINSFVTENDCYARHKTYNTMEHKQTYQNSIN